MSAKFGISFFSMDFMIFVISLSLILNVNSDDLNVCPNNTTITGSCSSIIECEKNTICYRNVKGKTENTFGCCDARCPRSRMPYGMNYEEDTDSFFSNCTKSHEYFNYSIPNSKSDACCPLPISEFVFGNYSRLLIKKEQYYLPTNWTSDDGDITQCCTAQDCPQTEYCGRVRNPGSDMRLVDRVGFVCEKHSKYDQIDQYLRFCYTYPDVNYTALGISERQKNLLEHNQLCIEHEDCWNSTHYCKQPKDHLGLNTIGSCTQILGSLIHSERAVETFRIDVSGGCVSNDQCNELGVNWLSYECQKHFMNPVGGVCVGYDIVCSESALYPFGKYFGCETNQDCMKGPEHEDKNHTPLCVEIPFLNKNKWKKETACCYEMNSCKFHLDKTPYGLSPLKSSMCSSQLDCQELADHMMKTQPGKRQTFLGRCLPETEQGYGKCCIADISSYCAVGRSIIPSKNCSEHSDCGWDNGSLSWCSDEGYCCRDHEGEKTWMCPDGKTMRLDQPKCNWNDEGDWCNGKAGFCAVDRCCPAIIAAPDTVNLWAESPWYYDNLTCTDTVDLPKSMDMVYCDPKRQVVTRMSRIDYWGARAQSALYEYCSSNDNCTNLTNDFVCVQETDGLRRCHTYYDRIIKWYLLPIPTAILGLLAFKLFRDWRSFKKYGRREDVEFYR